jgi:CheY-like chemotaxis protein
VRTLVAMHGGVVHAFSEGVGKGSTFTVRLPLLRELEAAAHATPAPLETTDEPLRIVVADDNEAAAHSLRMLLESAGHEVRTAATGFEALEQVERLRPEVVFMDIGMPGMDGLEATRRIRALPHGERVLIVALTGWGQLQDRERTRAAGVDLHIVKPISPEDLNAVLAQARERNATAL